MPGDSAIERAFYFLACGVARLVYRVKAIGIENLPTGGCLLVPNHITWVDAIILQLACSAAGSLYHRRGILSQTGTPAGAANGARHPDRSP